MFGFTAGTNPVPPPTGDDAGADDVVGAVLAVASPVLVGAPGSPGAASRKRRDELVIHCSWGDDAGEGHRGGGRLG